MTDVKGSAENCANAAVRDSRHVVIQRHFGDEPAGHVHAPPALSELTNHTANSKGQDTRNCWLQSNEGGSAPLQQLANKRVVPVQQSRTTPTGNTNQLMTVLHGAHAVLTHEQVYFLKRQHLVAGVAHNLPIRGAVTEVFRFQDRAATCCLARKAARQAEAAARAAAASGHRNDSSGSSL
jgi:hypothetical protein